jgi:hypothetical protein
MNASESPAVSADAGPHPGPRAGTDPIAVVVLGPAPDRRRGGWSMLLGVVNLISGAFLLVMFVSLSQGGDAAPWGPINDVLGAAGNVLLAALLPHLSRNAARSRWARRLVRTVTVASLVAAASGLALVTGVLPFEPSTAISIVAIVLQCGWMVWLNRRWSADPGVPRVIWRSGQAIGVALLAGLILTGASLLLPFGSLAANSLLIPAVALGGVAWILWPVWYLLVGRHLRRDDADR